MVEVNFLSLILNDQNVELFQMKMGIKKVFEIWRGRRSVHGLMQ
jgi:hypothetical protein